LYGVALTPLFGTVKVQPEKLPAASGKHQTTNGDGQSEAPGDDSNEMRTRELLLVHCAHPLPEAVTVVPAGPELILKLSVVGPVMVKLAYAVSPVDAWIARTE
jgi:hypothetical protein